MALSETAGQTPEPVTPEPVTPEPVTPEPVTPAPVTPEPVTPKPATAAPVTPEPATPAPEVKASSVRDGALTAASDDSVKELKTQGGAPTSSSGWVCDGQVRLEDPRKRSWSLGRAAFRAGPGYERVVLNLKRLGPGRGDVAALTAESMSTAKVRAAIPGVARPSLGQTTVSLHLTGDIAGNLGVRAYRPKGLRLLKEFSVYPAAGGSSRVLISAASDQCFRVRVPDWSAKGPNTRDAKVYIDIRS